MSLATKRASQKPNCHPRPGACAADPCVSQCRDDAKLFEELYASQIGRRETARVLRDRYKPTTHEYGDHNREYQAALDSLTDICKCWESLKEECCGNCGMDIGDLCVPDKAANKPPPRREEPKRKKPKEPGATAVKPSKEKLLGDALDQRTDADTEESLAKEAVTDCKAFSFKIGGEWHIHIKGKAGTGAVPGGGLEGGTEIIVKGEKDLGEVCEAVFGRGRRQKARELRNKAGHLEAQAKRDPPSMDYGQLVKPRINPVTIAAEVTDLERFAAISLEAEGYANAYLEAYGASYERYQGAQIAGDGSAMVRQAQAMVEFARRGLEARRKAAQYWYPFDSFLRQALDGSPALDADSSPQMDEQQLRSIGEWKARLDVTAEVAELAARNSGRPYAPEPRDVGTLLGLWVYARALLSEAQTAQEQRAPSAEGADDDEDLRPGLVQALGRRASFTRAHRGALAAPLDGAETDSSDTPAAWYTAQEVWFAWHQDNVVWSAGFDSRGNVRHAPRPIGKGRWPRLAANGDRVAIAWLTDDGASVRVRREEKWSNEITLSGGQVSIAFGPDGTLHAATTSGLFRLADANFVAVATIGFDQPALAIDSAGKPFVAWRRGPNIICGDDDLGEGERPSLAVDAEGVLELAYESRGTVVFRKRAAGNWSPPESVAVTGASWPTLAPATEGMRLTYLGPASYGPIALWLLRLPDRTPVLMPSIAGNVIETGLLVNFKLYNGRVGVHPHDLWLSVNDQVVSRMTNTIPEGRYYFELDPWRVFTSTGASVPNRIGINTWHINRGHYVSSTDYQLTVRTAWSEHFALASTTGEVLNTVKTLGVNHDQADLVVLANELDLPNTRPTSGQLDLRILVANLGEADSRPARLVMLGGDKFLGQSHVPILKPGEQQSVVFPLDAAAELPDVVFRLYQEGNDFDPSNDVMTVSLWSRPDRASTTSERQVTPDEDSVQRRNAVIDAINELAALVNAVINEINTVRQRIQGEDYAGAEASLALARDALTGGNAPFAELRRRQEGAGYRRIYELADRNREIQKELIGIADASISQAKARDAAGLSIFIDKHNELIGLYNRNVDEIGKIVNSDSLG
jgi:hypothetical protein